MEFSAKAQAFLELFTIANKMGEYGIEMVDDLAMIAVYQKVDELAAVLGAELPAPMAEVAEFMENSGGASA